MALLTQTFKDAITFTRKLNVRYLWIDSLCIIQDDPIDWQMEASRMCSVYENALLTLAAAKSIDGMGGCFAKSGSQSISSKIKTSGLSQTAIPLYIRQCPPHKELFKYTESSGDFPLLDRAWAFQERFLSPRVLYFGAEELLWECATTASCECNGLRPNTEKVAHKEALVTGSSSASDSWCRIVEQYTVKKLTFERDKLPALSGLAKQFYPHFRGGYMAGLWSQGGSFSLLWHAPTPASEKLKAWRAPSWSWASIEAPNGISWGNLNINHFESTTFIRYADMKYREYPGRGSDSYGEITAGRLCVDGFMHPVTGNEDLTQIHIPPWKSPRSFNNDYNLSQQDCGAISPDRNLYCLQVGYFYFKITYYLVLRCLNEKEQVYERVGVFSQFMKDKYDDGTEDLRLYEYRGRKEQTTIYIV
jgi:hypothetical protein